MLNQRSPNISFVFRLQGNLNEAVAFCYKAVLITGLQKLRTNASNLPFKVQTTCSPWTHFVNN
jgi:hypothetical protein